jgi:hypothetical protein
MEGGYVEYRSGMLWLVMFIVCSVWIYFSFRDDISDFLRRK